MPSATSPLVDDHQLAVDTIRTLSIDGVQQANSGHPGAPMGAAPMAYVLWTRFLRHAPPVPTGPTATGSCCRRATPACSCTRCCTSPATTCRSTS